METPSRHSFDLDGATRVFPIPSPIKGDNYCRLEVDGVIINDRSKYDIVNNSIVFIDVADVPNGSQLDVLVVQSEEAIGQLTITTNIDIVAQNITDVNTVADDITNVNTTAGSIANVNTVATNIADVNRVEDSITNIDRVHTSIGNIDRVHTSIDKLDRVHTSINNLDRVHTSIANVDRVNTSIANVDTVANDLNEPVSEIETVAGSITNVDTVGTNIANVNTVAGDISNVNAVVGNQINIDAVAGNATNINAVNANKTNIDSVAGNASNINAAVSNAANINAAVANATNINAVVANQTDIDTVAANNTNVTTVATNISNVNLAATNIADIQEVATEVAKVITVANDLNEATSEIDVVAASIANVDAVGADIANVNTVATNLTSVNSFADTYSIAATAPTGATEGDLWFDTTGDKMMVYNGGSWQNAGSSVNGTAARFKFTATASQTAFSGADANSNTLAYDAGYIDVYLNGVHLDPSDYTATDGSTITLAAGAAAGDELYVVAFGTFTLATHYTSAQVDALLAGISSTELKDSSGNTVVDTASGNVGIGTSSPTNLLHLDSGSGTTAWSKFENNTNYGYLGYDNSDAWLFYNGASESMRIDSSGRVGIGTSSPSAKLDIDSKTAGNYGSSVIVDSQAGTAKLRIDDYSNNSATTRMYIGHNLKRDGGGWGVDTASVGVTAIGFSDGNITFDTDVAGGSGHNERMRIDSSGRVTMPYQPHIFGSPGNGTVGSSGTASQFGIATSRGLSFSNSRITVPVSGVYLVTFQTIMDNNAGTGRKDSRVSVNGTTVSNGLNNLSDGGSGDYKMRTHSFTRYLSANDYIQFYSDAWYGTGSSFNDWQTASVTLLG